MGAHDRMRLQAYLARAGAAAILLDGRRVTLPRALAYLALNKPAGYLTTMKDEPGRNRPTIRSLMPSLPGLVPVGRLDAATTGLLLLTNDGALAHRVAHPSSQIEKEYEVVVRNSAPERALSALAAGPTLQDGPTLPLELTGLSRSPSKTTFHLTTHEGRNRIIRRACAAVGLTLLSLRRLRIGPVALGDLPEGTHRELTEEELAALRTHAR